MSAAPSMQWVGSQDPDVKSGLATYFYLYDDQQITLALPDFMTAILLDQFIKSVYQGGQMQGAKQIEFAVQDAIKKVLK